MKKNTILLVSKHEEVLETRSLILEYAGYLTRRCSDLPSALLLAKQAEMIILGHSFAQKQQEEFINAVHEADPNPFVLCLRFGILDPNKLLKICEECFRSPPGGSRVCVAEASNLVLWPKKR